MKFDELQNKMKSKDEKIATLEKSISTVKERCAAKLKVRADFICKNHNSKLSTYNCAAMYLTASLHYGPTCRYSCGMQLCKMLSYFSALTPIAGKKWHFNFSSLPILSVTILIW